MSFRPGNYQCVLVAAALAACGGGTSAPSSEQSASQLQMNASSGNNAGTTGVTIASTGGSPAEPSGNAAPIHTGTSVDISQSTVSGAAAQSITVSTTAAGATTRIGMRLIAPFDAFPNKPITGSVAGSVDRIMFITAGANIDFVDSTGKTGLAVPNNPGPGGACMHRQSTDGATPCFTNAGSMAQDATGNLYVTDTGLLRKVTPDRAATTIASFFPSNGYSISPKVSLSSPAVDAAGNVYIAANYTKEAAENPGATIIKKIAPDGTITDLVKGVPFSLVFALRVDKDNNLYINDNGKIMKRASDGGMTTVADISFPAGQGTVSGLAVDDNGNIYVSSNAYSGSTAHLSIKKITPAGQTCILVDGLGMAGDWIGPRVLPAVGEGGLYAVTVP